MLVRQMRAVSHSRALIRFNSSTASTGEHVARKRSIPRAEEFGDIKIQNVTKGNAGLSWVGNLGLENGSGLAARLARRKRQENGSGHNGASDNAATEVALNHDGTPRAPRLSIKETSPANREKRPYVQRGERRQGEANRDENVRPQRRGGAGGAGDRTARPQRGDSQNRTPRRPRTEQRSSVDRTAKGSSGVTDTAAVSEDSVDCEDSSPKTTRPVVQIQQSSGGIAVTASELDKLFASSSRSDAVGAVAAMRPRAQNLQNDTVARRVQDTLESRGGDYSRYMSEDLGTSFPEQLGPLGSARLVLAHRPDVGLKSREKALGTVQSLVVNKIVETQPVPSA